VLIHALLKIYKGETMATFNKTILLGRLTRDPEIKMLSGGKNVCTFSLAVNRPGKDNEADFFLVETWDKLAGLCAEYLKKGSAALVEGALRQEKWEDKNHNLKSRTKIVAFGVQFLSSVDNVNDNSVNAGNNQQNDGACSGSRPF